MTVTLEPGPGAPAPDGPPTPGGEGRTVVRRPRREPRFAGPLPGSPWWIVRTSAFWLAAVAVLFVLDIVVVTQIQYAASQSRDYATLRESLANATVPVSQTDPEGRLTPVGTPVALISIPAIGMRNVVVVEGTSADALRRGPGHERDTRFPGQPGVSILQGRAAAYGGPFGDIDRLRTGDTITVVTGQDVNTFRVTGTRREGDPTPRVVAGQSRLTLVTATGFPFAPDGTLRVDAVLVGTPKDPSVVYASDLPTAEQPLGTMPDSLPVTILALQGLVLVVVLAVWGWTRWGRWRTWIAFGPVVALAVALIGNRIVLLLPNLL
ncbi:sortase [Jatrophihabitans sp. YIM 134969]